MHKDSSQTAAPSCEVDATGVSGSSPLALLCAQACDAAAPTKSCSLLCEGRHLRDKAVLSRRPVPGTWHDNSALSALCHCVPTGPNRISSSLPVTPLSEGPTNPEQNSDSFGGITPPGNPFN